MDRRLSRPMLRPVRVCSLLLILGAVLWGLGAAGDTRALAEDAPLGGAPGDVAPSRPNIILILTDDMGHGDIGAFGAQSIVTPALDMLARNGAVLTDFYASANVCTPSRAGLLTGRYPVRSGLAKGVIFPYSDYGLPASEVTLAEVLRAAGYRTAMVGKWHLGHVPGAWPTDHGFDSYFGLPYSNDMQPLALYRGTEDRGTEELAGPVDQTVLTRQYTREAIEVIEAHGRAGDGERARRDQPFFLYLAHTFPHLPLFASDNFRDRSDAGRYGDTVEEIDWSTGAIVSALKRLDLFDNTLIIFTSDNGPWFEGSAGSLRGRKGGTFEGGFRVPFIAHWPEGVPAGARSGAMAMNIDLMPTLAALVGAEIPDTVTLDGRDILPLMRGAAQSPHEVLYFFSNDTIAALRTDRWRLVVRSYYLTYDIPLDQFGYSMLFDLDSPHGESYSVANRYPAVLERMNGLLAQGRSRLEGLPQTFTPPRLPSTDDGADTGGE